MFNTALKKLTKARSWPSFERKKLLIYNVLQSFDTYNNKV